MKRSLHACHRRKTPRGWSVAAFFTILLICCLWIWQGFDVTDEGFHLTSQWLAVSEPDHYEFGMAWLTDVVGGCWLFIIGELGLIGARLGWVLLMGTTGLTSFLILRRYFRPITSLLAVVSAALASMYHGTMTINYNNFPALLLIGATGLILVSQERGNSRHRQTWFAILGGLLLGLGVMARFPLVLSLFLPFGPAIVRALIRHKMPSKISLIRAVTAFCSAIVTILTCLAFLYLTNHLKEYWEAINTALFGAPSSSSHAPGYLLHLYFNTGKSAMLWGLKLLFAGLAIALGLMALFHLIRRAAHKAARAWAIAATSLIIGVLLVITSSVVLTPAFIARHLSSDGILENATLVRIQASRIGAIFCGGLLALVGVTVLLFPCFPRKLADYFSKVRTNWYLVPAVLFGLLFFGLVQQQAGGRGTYSLVLPGVCFVLASFQLILSFLTPRSLTTHQTDRFVLLGMGFFIALLKLLGSNNGVASAKDAMWLLFPAALLLVPESLRVLHQVLSSKLSSSRESERRVSVEAIKKFAIAAMFAIAFVGFHIRAENPYRDLTDRFQLTTQLQHERLRGVLTSAGRAESVNQLLAELDHLVGPGDVVLAYSAIPMIHYVTETVPALGNPWPTIMQSAELEEQLSALFGSGSLPQIVVRTKTDTANRIWGTRAIAPPQAPLRRVEDIRILDEWIQGHGYCEIWANREFAIYEPFPEASCTSDIAQLPVDRVSNEE